MAGDYWMPLRGHDTSGACPPLSFRPSDPGLGPGSESRNPVTTERHCFEGSRYDPMAKGYWMPAYAGMTLGGCYAHRCHSGRATRAWPGEREPESSNHRTLLFRTVFRIAWPVITGCPYAGMTLRGHAHGCHSGRAIPGLARGARAGIQ